MKARFFNNITVNDNIVTKSSTDIFKIKSEFKYYYLLPDDLKRFFVKPFNYRETETEAMYDMNYAGITLYEFIRKYSDKYKFEFDKAIQLIIDQLNDYFKIRNKYTKEITEQNNFVYNKVIKRNEQFKKLPEYDKIQNFLKANDLDLEDIINKFKLYYQCLPSISNKQTIAHGDLHFSNILVDEETFDIKFIDVKGAMHQSDLYMDQYYDLAKLYHSIKGMYDCIINDKYELVLNDNLDSYSIQIQMCSFKDCETYQKIYEELYKDISKKDKEIIRIYTASLFLSMLPLHKDSLKRILAFIKIATNFLNNDLNYNIKKESFI